MSNDNDYWVCQLHLSNHIGLPIYAPSGVPRLIDLKSLSKMPNSKMKGLRAADAVVTTLYMWHPIALQHFINQQRFQNFHFRHTHISQKLKCEFFVERIGHSVHVSTI
jgi:hypothetical protein